jgi:hypothetical protein
VDLPRGMGDRISAAKSLLFAFLLGLVSAIGLTSVAHRFGGYPACPYRGFRRGGRAVPRGGFVGGQVAGVVG